MFSWVKNLGVKHRVKFVDQNFLCHEKEDETVCQEWIMHLVYKTVHPAINV